VGAKTWPMDGSNIYKTIHWSAIRTMGPKCAKAAVQILSTLLQQTANLRRTSPPPSKSNSFSRLSIAVWDTRLAFRSCACMLNDRINTQSKQRQRFNTSKHNWIYVLSGSINQGHLRGGGGERHVWYGSFHSWMNVRGCAGKTVQSLNTASHTWALLQWGSLHYGVLHQVYDLYLYC